MRQRYVVSEGVRLHCHEAGRGPLVLLLHGFPELGFSWRHQVDALAAAGFHAVAPDLPGYGRSDKPDVTYDIEWINGVISGLVPALGHERAVVVGHDWGGFLAWHFARRHAARTAGVVGVNTPDLPRPPMPPIQLLRQMMPDTPIYMIGFQDRGVAEWILSWGRGADDFVEMIFRNAGTVNLEAFGDEVLAVYAEAFRPIGALTPPIEYYRNMDRNWELTADLADVPVRAPALMICAEGDPVLPPALSEGMEARVPDLRRALVRDCGHWTQQERPVETNDALLAFLGDLDSWD